MVIIVKELEANAFKELSIQNVKINVEEIYLVVMYVSKNVQQNVSVIKNVQIRVLMDTVQKNVAKFVLIVMRNANLNVIIPNVPNYAANYVTGNHAMKDAKKK